MSCFDCNGVCMPMVVRVSGDVLYMYYVGWGPSPPGLFANQCGLAVSNDSGRTWERWSEASLPLQDGNYFGVLIIKHSLHPLLFFE